MCSRTGESGRLANVMENRSAVRRVDLPRRGVAGVDSGVF